MTEVILALIGVIGSVFAYLFGRKRTSAEIKVIEEGTKTVKIDNEIKVSEYYRTILDELPIRYEAKFREIVSLYEAKEKILKDEIILLRRQIGDLKKEINVLRRRVKELE